MFINCIPTKSWGTLGLQTEKIPGQLWTAKRHFSVIIFWKISPETFENVLIFPHNLTYDIWRHCQPAWDYIYVTKPQVTNVYDVGVGHRR